VKKKPNPRFPAKPRDRSILNKLIDKWGGAFACVYGRDGEHNEINLWVEHGKVAIRIPGLSPKQAEAVLQVIDDNSERFWQAGALNFIPGDEDVVQ
jgi:hypothetical protein